MGNFEIQVKFTWNINLWHKIPKIDWPLVDQFMSNDVPRNPNTAAQIKKPTESNMERMKVSAKVIDNKSIAKSFY